MIFKRLHSVVHVFFIHSDHFVSIGSYQIHRAKSYIQDHLKPAYYNPDELLFFVEIPDGFDDLVRARFQSGHSNSKYYFSTIQFNINDSINPVKGWCCTCTVGLRVVGCCSHVCALLWHLGVNRGVPVNSTNPLSATNFTDMVKDSIQLSDDDDDDDDFDDNIRYSLFNGSTDNSNGDDTDSTDEDN